jgi:eukaryotic-like serine/threonine-protein kinase
VARPASAPPEIPGLDFIQALGTGGFSDVYLYQQRLPRRQVAVKVLLTDGLDPVGRKAFVDEANVMAQLSAHPYIVTIYHADVAPGDKPYFVMEYCSGPSLSTRYKTEQFSADDVLRIGVRLASAIATAHSVGILHRDIKPANVLTNDFGWPALTDFGISSTLDDELPTMTTTIAAGGFDTGSNSSQSVGMSIPWSPPEMFDDDPQPDVRSDVFSLAATLYTLLAGRTPFEIAGRSNGAIDLISRIERGEITPMDRTDVPRSLLAALHKGMAVARTDRYATAVDFARALQRVELELGYSPTGIEVPNLNLAHDRPVAVAGGEDETRVRDIMTVAAQPVAPLPIVVPPIASAPVVSAPTAAPVFDAASGETVVRGRVPVVAEPAPAPAPAPAVEAEPAAPPSRRGIVVAVVSLFSILLIAAVVVASVLLGGTISAGPDAADDDPAPDGGSAIVEQKVPDPENGTAQPSADGTSVVFSWTNPDEQDGDSYRYALSANPGSPKPLDEPTVTIDGIVPGSLTCVDAYIRRGGQLSANPLTICYPEQTN